MIITTSAVHAAEATDENLSLDLTKPGFALLSDIAKDDILNSLVNAQLPDQQITVPLLSVAKIKGITYTVALKSLAITPKQDALGILAVIDNIHINIDKIRFESWAMPVLGTTCTATSINIGRHQDLPLQASLGAAVNDSGIQLKLQSFNFDIDKSQYSSSGPSECRGPFAVRDYLTQFVLDAVLTNARPAIEAGVKLRMRSIAPKIAAQLNALAVKPMTLDTPDLIVVPASRLAVTAKPTALTLSPESMSIKLAIQVTSTEEESLPLPRPLYRHAGTLFGSLGFHPAFVNSVLAATLKNGTLPIALNPEMNPLIEILTNREELSTFWPDLSVVQDAGDTLKLFARLAAPPVLTILTAHNGWHLSVPDLELKYQLFKNGVWIDYTYLNVHLELDTAPSIADGQMTLKVFGGSAVATSTWASSYTPIDPTFEAETVNEILAMVINLLAESTEPPQLGLPIFTLAGRNLMIDQLRIEGDFTKLDLVEAR
jgi:hypothetical protein